MTIEKAKNGSALVYKIIGALDTETAPNLEALQKQYTAFPNLVLRDRTTRPVDVWGSLGEDSFEGVYFGLLRKAMEETQDDNEKKELQLAAELSRQLLEGQEVSLP